MGMVKKMQIHPFVADICQRLRKAGGRAFLAGGCVRDMWLGLSSRDFDIEVYGLPLDQVQQAIAPLGRCEQVGKSFGVIKLRQGGIEADIALPRRERKSGPGHRGFDVQVDPYLSPEVASSRRDFTINAMMYDAESGALLDFHGGRNDLEAGILRHVSPTFAEDPLRVLRGMQFAARFDLELDEETALLCQQLRREANTLAAERIWAEWRKWAMAEHPARGLVVLEKSGWIELYPELAAMRSCPQNTRWHPEGDVWTHTCLTVDQAACVATARGWQDERRLYLVLAALCHDIGKPATTIDDGNGCIRSPGHSMEGTEINSRFMQRIGAPASAVAAIAPLIREHMTHMHGTPTKRAVRRLSHRLQPVNIALWEALVEADASSRPPHPPARPALSWLNEAQALGHHEEKPVPIVNGRMLMAMGVQPGPGMGKLIAAAYEAQLDGAFDNEDTARQWCRKHLRSIGEHSRTEG